MIFITRYMLSPDTHRFAAEGKCGRTLHCYIRHNRDFRISCYNVNGSNFTHPGHDPECPACLINIHKDLSQKQFEFSYDYKD